MVAALLLFRIESLSIFLRFPLTAALQLSHFGVLKVSFQFSHEDSKNFSTWSPKVGVLKVSLKLFDILIHFIELILKLYIFRHLLYYHNNHVHDLEKDHLL